MHALVPGVCICVCMYDVCASVRIWGGTRRGMEVPNLISFNLITLAFNHCRHGPYWQFDAPALPVAHLERVRRGRKEEEKRKQFPHYQSVRNNLLLTSSAVTDNCNSIIICICASKNLWSVRLRKDIGGFVIQCYGRTVLEKPCHGGWAQASSQKNQYAKLSKDGTESENGALWWTGVNFPAFCLVFLGLQIHHNLDLSYRRKGINENTVQPLVQTVRTQYFTSLTNTLV